MSDSWRKVAGTMAAQKTSDGAGVTLNRSIGSAALPDFDPFLLLDEFNTEEASDYIAGFPDHPHRGFETVTYMIEGRMRHRDSTGEGGVLRSGSVQWMTAGRGIVHSEMPEQEDGLMQGFQLWVNLPAADKMCPPRYRNIEPDAVPEVTVAGGAVVRVVAGRVGEVEGAIDGVAVEPLYLDVRLPAGAVFTQDVPRGHNGFVYVFEGAAEIGLDGAGATGSGVAVPAGTLAVLGDGARLALAAKDSATRLLLIAGRPLGEPIARHGPFVMNTREEIAQAFEDFQAGKF